jgi:hypothetical protein
VEQYRTHWEASFSRMDIYLHDLQQKPPEGDNRT